MALSPDQLGDAIEPATESLAAAPHTPKVSVIIAVYNSQNTLERCLNSVMCQTFTDIEIVVINDGSRDDSFDIAYKLSCTDPRIRILSQTNKGVSRTRNRGLKEARGEWLYFVDSDDSLVPDAIELMYLSTQQDDCDLVVCDFWRSQKGRIVHKGGNPTKTVSQRQFVKTMSKYPSNLYYACLWNKFFKRQIVEDCGICFDTALQFGEDHVFVLEYLRQVRRIALVGKPLYYYNDTPGSLVHQAMNPVDIGLNKALVLEKLARLCHDLDMASSPMELFRLAKFLITPSWDYLVLPLPGRSMAKHMEFLGEAGYTYDLIEGDENAIEGSKNAIGTGESVVEDDAQEAAEGEDGVR